jgi:hypothetical protein
MAAIKLVPDAAYHIAQSMAGSKPHTVVKITAAESAPRQPSVEFAATLRQDAIRWQRYIKALLTCDSRYDDTESVFVTL